LSKYLGFATAEPHFNIAMAIVWVLMTLGIQFVSTSNSSILWRDVSPSPMGRGALRIFNFIYEYVPFRWKWIITIEKGELHPAVFYPAWVVIKAFDIVISLFVWFLDIIGIFAKVISLAFRLFGNMLSGTALLTVLVVWLGGATQWRFGFEFPILGPIILFVQGLLVASIQAFVFPLLIAIFVKVARMWEEDNQQATT
jgi:F0F1-type ATP synthase membrane subunit a